MAEKDVIRTDRAPGPFQGAPYNQAIRVGDLVFVAGQLGISLETGLTGSLTSNGSISISGSKSANGNSSSAKTRAEGAPMMSTAHTTRAANPTTAAIVELMVASSLATFCDSIV